MAGSLVWLRTHQPELQHQVTQGLLNDFQAEQAQVIANLPEGLQLVAEDSWGFELKGDELWVQAPALQKVSGEPPSPEEFEAARARLTESLHRWLSGRPGDGKRFPILVRFRGEATAPALNDASN